jgi:chitinase
MLHGRHVFAHCTCFIFAGFVALLAALPASAQFAVSVQALPKRLVADYGYWSKSQNPPYGAAQIPFHKLTHVIHAGLTLDRKADGSFSTPSGFLEPLLIVRAHAAGVKVLALLGGDMLTFRTVAGDPTLRATLAQNLQSFVTRYGYDGVDIDWEYPGTNDRLAYVGLMQAIRAVLPTPGYLISADVAPWGGYGYDFPGVEPLLDFFNVMMYDCAGPWTTDGQLNSPIFNDPKNPQPQGNVKDTADLFLSSYHLPPGKLNMGTPFYGYLYSNVTQLWGPCVPCSGSTVFYEPYGTFIKPRVNHWGWAESYDRISLVPYLLRTDGKPGFITFDDPRSTYYRVWYSVWKRGFGGSFMWALDEDYDGRSQELLEAMYRAISNHGVPPETIHAVRAPRSLFRFQGS